MSNIAPGIGVAAGTVVGVGALGEAVLHAPSQPGALTALEVGVGALGIGGAAYALTQFSSKHSGTTDAIAPATQEQGAQRRHGYREDDLSSETDSDYDSDEDWDDQVEDESRQLRQESSAPRTPPRHSEPPRRNPLIADDAEPLPEFRP